MQLNLKQKNVLFVTTKNLDYIRNTQEITLIKKEAKSYAIIGSLGKNYLTRLLSVYLMLLKTPISKFDIVFIGFAPQLVLPFFKHKFQNKYIIIDFFLSLFDTLCQDRKIIKPQSLAGRILHHIDQTPLHQANLVVCDTVAHGKYFSAEFGILPDKLYPLYLQANTAIYHPMAIQKPAHLKAKYLVLYFGSVLPLQGIDIVLQAIALLKEEKNIHFYFIGPLKEKNKHTLCPDATNVDFWDWLPQDQLASHIGQADLCLAGHFNATIDKARRTIPGKAFIYHAMEKPMILGDNPANHELFQPDPSHIFVEMGNASVLADAILESAKQQGY